MKGIGKSGKNKNGNSGIFLQKENYKELGFEDIQIDYLLNRIDDQINWYDKNSARSKRKATIVKIIVMGLSAFIPVLTNLGLENTLAKVFISVIAAFITFTEGFSSFKKYNENWIEYRRVCETIKHEKFMFIYKSGIYQNEDSDFNYFVERAESIISQENLNWASLNKTKGDK